MKLKQVVAKLNNEHLSNKFRFTSLAAKRDRNGSGAWALVHFVNQSPWRDFSAYKVELYEAIPDGWPLSDVAERLNCSVRALQIVERYNPKAKCWRKVSEFEHFEDEIIEAWETQYERQAKNAGY